MKKEVEYPIIGITTGMSPPWRAGKKHYMAYASVIKKVGGKPAALGPGRRGRLADCHGILVTGGCDIHSRHYTRRRGDELLSFEDLKKKYKMTWEEARDDYELPLVYKALNIGIPVLAICRGIQLINVLFGGGLIPDLSVCIGDQILHTSRINGVTARHDVNITSGSKLSSIIQADKLRVNSYHHQGLRVEDLAPSLRVVAMAEDGVVEAVEGINHPWLIAVQWHPERAKDKACYQACRPLFKEFIRAAERGSGSAYL